jgi:ABC-type multidrug transport system permease subunit
MAIWVAPLLLGPIAVVLGILAEIRGDRLGRWIVLAAVLTTGLGLLLGLLPNKFLMN